MKLADYRFGPSTPAHSDTRQLVQIPGQARLQVNTLPHGKKMPVTFCQFVGAVERT